MRLNFHYDSIKKLRNKRWYVVAKGMRELALMNIRQALPEVTGFVNNKNEILRMESRIAIMKLSDHEPLSFLSRETEPLSGWDSANIYTMLTKMPEKMIPDFSAWLNSTNPDVVLFCIQMIGAFRQQDSIDKVLTLLNSEDEKIRYETIRSIRLLNASEAEKSVVELFPKENLYIKAEILKTLEVIGSANSAPFLEKLVQTPKVENPILIQAVRVLLALGNAGNEIVDRIFRQADESLQLIINHAKDKRL
jgi:HEAT repeat protein